MKTSELIAKAQTLWLELSSELVDVQLSSDSARNLEYFQLNLMNADSAIRQLKTMVENHQFQNWGSEIYFFKELKPNFIAEFIYYSKIIELESTIPKAGKDYVREVLEKELDLLKRFAEENRDFIAYIRKGASHSDMQYFIRANYDLYLSQSVLLHSHDERFSTSHDNLVSLILANNKYEIYLSSRLQGLDTYYLKSTAVFKSPLEWTGSKAGLVELLTALYQSKCFNHGHIEFSKVIRTVESSFNIDLGNFHKTLGEIRDRKIERTKFLNQLSDTLVRTFEEAEQR